MKQHLTRLRPREARDTAKKRCLAAPIGSIETDTLTGMQRKIHIAQHSARRVTLPVSKADALKAENGCIVMVVRH